jgi:hypothetical protein
MTWILWPADLPTLAHVAACLTAVASLTGWTLLSSLLYRTMGASIFISYRRSDNPEFAARLFDALRARFSRSPVFMDTAAIEPGADIHMNVGLGLAQSDFVIAVIGQNWMGARYDGKLRLLDSRDYVRSEIALALNSKRVIPVLIDSTRRPTVDDLRLLEPIEVEREQKAGGLAWLDQLSRLNAISISTEAGTFLDDVRKKLLKRLRCTKRQFAAFWLLNLWMLAAIALLSWAVWSLGDVQLFTPDSFAKVAADVMVADEQVLEELKSRHEGKWVHWSGYVNSVGKTGSLALLNIVPRKTDLTLPRAQRKVEVALFCRRASEEWKDSELPAKHSYVRFAGHVDDIAKPPERIRIAKGVFLVASPPQSSDTH